MPLESAVNLGMVNGCRFSNLEVFNENVCSLKGKIIWTV